jgi:hypothetical protein
MLVKGLGKLAKERGGSYVKGWLYVLLRLRKVLATAPLGRLFERAISVQIKLRESLGI